MEKLFSSENNSIVICKEVTVKERIEFLKSYTRGVVEENFKSKDANLVIKEVSSAITKALKDKKVLNFVSNKNVIKYSLFVERSIGVMEPSSQWYFDFEEAKLKSAIKFNSEGTSYSSILELIFLEEG